MLLNSTVPLCWNKACSMMTPSSGIIAHHHTGKKYNRRSAQAKELDFYPDFTCRKPKLKLNLMKFDSKQQKAITEQKMTNSDSSTQIAKAIHTNSLPLSGIPRSTDWDSPSLTPIITCSPLPNLTPRDKRPSTRPALIRYSPFRTISRSRIFTGIVSIPHQGTVPQNPVPVPITGHLRIFNLPPLPLYPLTPRTSTCVLAELTFVIVTTVTPELPQPQSESIFGDPKSLANQ